MLRTLTLLCLGSLAHAALAQPGTLDPTFGTGGVVQINLSSSADIGTDLLPMVDGRLLVCGLQTPSTGSPEPFILRLLPDGTLDPDYGIVILSHGGNGRAEGMVFAADSSVYLCGYADTLGHDRFTLWHVLPDGTPDPAFGLNGRVSVPLTGIYEIRALDIAVQLDGKLILAGNQYYGTWNSFLGRFNTDGTLDSTFGYNGLLTMNNSDNAHDEFFTVDVLDDGSIVAGGYGKSGGMEYPLIVKLTPAGIPDSTFDGDGILTPTLSFAETRVTCLVAVGQEVVAGGARYTGISTTSDYFLIRFDDTGMLDPSFGTLGEQATDVDADDYIRDLTILADGRIAVAGYTGNSTNGVGYIDLLTAVHTSDGAPYTTFGGNGYAIHDGFTYVDEGYAVKEQVDGKLVMCGSSSTSTLNSVVTILRYENDVNTMVTSTAQEAGLLAWPNPANDHLRLRRANNSAAHLEILDATGRVVRSMRTTDASGLVIPVADLQPGRYLLRCTDEIAVRVVSFQVAR
ncbi:MAG: T9SS type A sorting domain-containing protein [Flavobacteriales bacterium]|nr:T9SS type A sorting domain-containing protein [Flavobacteriales bacterium]MBP6697684.1 T9SS type A sorting domain-containing protein [Flavobacteriales bacterium]